MCRNVPRIDPRQYGELIFSALLIFLIEVPTAASDREDAAVNAVATAFLQVREAAHLSKLERMGRNTF